MTHHYFSFRQKCIHAYHDFKFSYFFKFRFESLKYEASDDTYLKEATDVLNLPVYSYPNRLFSRCFTSFGKAFVYVFYVGDENETILDANKRLNDFLELFCTKASQLKARDSTVVDGIPSSWKSSDGFQPWHHQVLDRKHMSIVCNDLFANDRMASEPWLRNIFFFMSARQKGKIISRIIVDRVMMLNLLCLNLRKWFLVIL